MTDLIDILYVEDEPNIREIALLALEEIGGFKIRACESGKQALETLKNYTPQLFLLDVMMPQMDGITLISAIRELPNAKNIPVIFMTAKVQSHEITKYKALGGIGTISKPFDAMQLANDVRNLWDKRHD